MSKKLPPGIIQLASGKYQVRPYDRELKKKGTAHIFDTLSEAVAYKEKVDAGKVKATARVWTCDEWAEHWTSDPRFNRPKESTNIHNAERVSKFATDFAGVPLHKLDRPTARAWALENQGRILAVRAMLNDARFDQVIENNPFEQLRIPRGKGRKHIEPMTEKEVRALALAADELWENWPVMSSMIVFSAYSGLRLGEMLALRWGDIDWEAGTIKVSRQWQQKTRNYGTPKSGQTRVVALFEPAAVALRKIPKSPVVGGDLIFYSPRDKKIEPALHDYYWRQVRARFLGRLEPARVTEIALAWHSLRHFTASWLVDRGARPDDVAGQLGHTDGGKLVQELYGHLYADNSVSRLQTIVAA